MHVRCDVTSRHNAMKCHACMHMLYTTYKTLQHTFTSARGSSSAIHRGCIPEVDSDDALINSLEADCGSLDTCCEVPASCPNAWLHVPLDYHGLGFLASV